MKMTELKAILEGLLFASGDDGITVKQLSRILEVNAATVEHLLEELKYDYEHVERGMMIMQSHQVFHLTTKPEHSAYFKRLLETPQTSRMSQAALETLAIIAYRQPITRTEIEEIRGVKSDRPVQTLLSRSLIEEVGRRDGVGRPILFGTSKDFLIYFGLTSLEELPPLPENVDQEDIEHEADLFFEKFHTQMDNNMAD
ncbi:SMC-Scp complex subunit ScpB [Virgibacillus dakarensis]|uniref:Segregation and condensation protein B n=1 Tax=Lentibacillus populi TaxID=1827502 RepID=A0A9W5X4S5_9BACI|nr:MULTISPECIES: SMC-Scp complex subunit ScpB [Bacillaceae]MBT2214312.1 SMC-Scp complex subunit ScpB [Virgibacillus dakarensis]MTW84989.1 SMC-Scp complex subunit ScpB [Virgibacillus dakarensis]GGB33864.1 segregation and condensation protein B [Lentibacillus populi]